jgi:hypothetical protein
MLRYRLLTHPPRLLREYPLRLIFFRGGVSSSFNPWQFYTLYLTHLWSGGTSLIHYWIEFSEVYSGWSPPCSHFSPWRSSQSIAQVGVSSLGFSSQFLSLLPDISLRSMWFGSSGERYILGCLRIRRDFQFKLQDIYSGDEMFCTRPFGLVSSPNHIKQNLGIRIEQF